MMRKSPGPSDSSPASPLRRRLLSGFVGAYTATLVPWALAQPIRTDQQGAFLALSAIIAGRQSLNAGMADRVFKALSAEQADFPASPAVLLRLIDERKIDPMQLQQTLDGEKSPLAPLPRKIATAWFLGVIGSGTTAYVIAYEHALNAQMVADVLKPPTYAYGPYCSGAPVGPDTGARLLLAARIGMVVAALIVLLILYMIFRPRRRPLRSRRV